MEFERVWGLKGLERANLWNGLAWRWSGFTISRG